MVLCKTIFHLKKSLRPKHLRVITISQFHDPLISPCCQFLMSSHELDLLCSIANPSLKDNTSWWPPQAACWYPLASSSYLPISAALKISSKVTCSPPVTKNFVPCVCAAASASWCSRVCPTVAGRHHIPLANYVCSECCPQRVTSVSQDIELSGTVVVLRLNVLKDIKLRIALVHFITWEFADYAKCN